MADTAAFCVDHLSPRVPARQYVLSLPYALRFKMAYSPEATVFVHHRRSAGDLDQVFRSSGMLQTRPGASAAHLD
jgi:hypothetical protein